MADTKIGIAMSGGVDSTACALLLREQYDVHGFFMQLAQPDFAKQLQRVTEVAKQCNIPLHIIDLRSQFEQKVLTYFSDTYKSGRTPNPCMICNPEIKFGLFMTAILAWGMDRMATGHYANIVHHDDCFRLCCGADSGKDQSYFLARLSQQQLAKVDFPLAKLTKESVYTLVEDAGFIGFRGQESQDVCFLGAESVGTFLETLRPDLFATGNIVTADGTILGTHNGIHNYTIGQRKGLGIADTTPWYVSRLDAADNLVVVVKNEDLFQDIIDLKNVLWSCGKPPLPNRTYTTRIRYRHRGAAATVTQRSAGTYRLEFTEKQRAVTPGQFAVLYDDDMIVGSGEIQ